MVGVTNGTEVAWLGSLGWVFAILASGLLGALISTWVYVRRDKRQFRIRTLKAFAANRYDLSGDEFSRALNEIFVVFNDAQPVMDALRQFHEAVITPGVNSEDRLVQLYKAMCDAAGIDYSDFNDSFFLRPFNTRAGSATASRNPETG